MCRNKSTTWTKVIIVRCIYTPPGTYTPTGYNFSGLAAAVPPAHPPAGGYSPRSRGSRAGHKAGRAVGPWTVYSLLASQCPRLPVAACVPARLRAPVAACVPLWGLYGLPLPACVYVYKNGLKTGYIIEETRSEQTCFFYYIHEKQASPQQASRQGTVAFQKINVSYNKICY